MRSRRPKVLALTFAAGTLAVASADAAELATLRSAHFTVAAPRGPVSYPQSASFVEHHVEAHGLDKLLLAYGRLRSSGRNEVRAANRSELASTYGRTLEQLETDRRRSVCDEAPPDGPAASE